MDFMSGPIDRWAGIAFVTPNCMPGVTIWIGKLIFTASRHEDQRGFDFAWGNYIFWTVNFKEEEKVNG